MATINAIAHLNELTKDVKNDYYLTAQVTETLDVEGIIQRLRARELATKNVDGPAFVQTFLDECAAAAAEGNNIVTSFFRSSIGIQGVLLSNDLGHNIPAERLKVSVNLTQGEGARKAIESAVIYAFEQSGATGPVIQTVTDPTENVADHLNPGGMVLLQGMRLSLKGDDPAVGIHFVKDGQTPEVAVFIPASKVSPNTPTKLQFILPATVTDGKWSIQVATQASGTKQLKEPRSFLYPSLVIVGEESDRPSEI